MASMMSEGNTLLETLMYLGVDPELAQAAAGRIDMPKQPHPGLQEDGEAAKRLIADLQNGDRTRNGGNRNRTAPVLMEPGSGFSEPTPLAPAPFRLEDFGHMADEESMITVPPYIDRMAGDAVDRFRNPIGKAIGDITGIGGTRAEAGPLQGPFWPGPVQGPNVPDGWRKPEATSAPGEGRGASTNPARAPNPEAQAGLPSDENVSPNPLNRLQQFTQDRFAWDEDQRSDIARALMAGGFATMAGESPYAMENIGKGGLVGMDQYYEGKDDRLERARQEEIDQMARERHARTMANDAEGQIFEDLERAQNLIQLGLDPADYGIDIGRLGIDDAMVEEWSRQPMDDVQKLRAIRAALEADGMPPEQSLDAALAILGKRAPAEAGIGGL
jgi:hypothetical protein